MSSSKRTSYADFAFGLSTPVGVMPISRSDHCCTECVW